MKKGHSAYSSDKHKSANSTQKHGMHGRKPYWAKDMSEGFPRANVTQKMDRMSSSCDCEYAAPGYNKELLSRAHAKMHSGESGYKPGDFV